MACYTGKPKLEELIRMRQQLLGVLYGGAERVTFEDGRSVTYRSEAEIKRTLAKLNGDIDAAIAGDDGATVAPTRRKTRRIIALR